MRRILMHFILSYKKIKKNPIIWQLLFTFVNKPIFMCQHFLLTSHDFWNRNQFCPDVWLKVMGVWFSGIACHSCLERLTIILNCVFGRDCHKFLCKGSRKSITSSSIKTIRGKSHGIRFDSARGKFVGIKNMCIV